MRLSPVARPRGLPKYDSWSASYREFHKRMARFAQMLNTFFNKTPPRLGTKNFEDLATLGRLGFDLRRMGKKEMREFQKKNLIAALGQTNWRVSGKDGAAELLGVRPTTLADRIKTFKLKKPQR